MDQATTHDVLTIKETGRTRSALAEAVDQVNRVVVGKSHAVARAFAAVLASGHLLIEDLPGVGKTTLAHALAASLGLTFKRIQFTSDMLPADIVGVSIFSQTRDSFEFHPGPVFSQVVLADEINRGTPKTQSALLEAMAENQISVDGETHQLPQPFLVVATQNPTELAGTYALPESQLDRFVIRLTLGYPDPAAEKALLQSGDRRDMVSQLAPKLSAGDVLKLQQMTRDVHVSDALLDYVQALLQASRSHARIEIGLSPRAGLSILRMGQAWALLQDREYCQPEDIKAVFVDCAAHRLHLAPGAEQSADEVALSLLDATRIP